MAPWRTKMEQGKKKLQTVSDSGHFLSFNQIEFYAPGFIVQIKGGLTKNRYKSVEVFIDHHSCLYHVHLQQDLTSEKKIQANHIFKAYSIKHRVSIKNYHVNNGQFSDNEFLQDISIQSQKSPTVASTHISKTAPQKNASETYKDRQENNSNTTSQYGHCMLSLICVPTRYGRLTIPGIHFQTRNMAPFPMRGSQGLECHKNSGTTTPLAVQSTCWETSCGHAITSTSGIPECDWALIWDHWRGMQGPQTCFLAWK